MKRVALRHVACGFGSPTLLHCVEEYEWVV